jgi:hypothetical protein
LNRKGSNPGSFYFRVGLCLLGAISLLLIALRALLV